MMNRRVLLSGASAALAQAVLLIAQPHSGAKMVFEHDLPDLTMKDWSVTVVEVNNGPGEASTAHRHPGITIAYVLEGEIRSKVGDDPEKTYQTGQMFLERPNQLHAVSANAKRHQTGEVAGGAACRKREAVDDACVARECPLTMPPAESETSDPRYAPKMPRRGSKGARALI
jgi:quercetin dioxygenase-like cupin family protein